MQFERLAFDANAAIDSLRPGRPFPLPLKTARRLLMPLFVLAELRVGVSRSQKHEENARGVDALAERCELLIPDGETIDFYVRVRNDIERVRFRRVSRNAKHLATTCGSPHFVCSTMCRC